MNLKKSLAIGVVITIIATLAWELYWRNNGFRPSLNDEKALWALERHKVDDAIKTDVIIIGSSRAYFDIQVNEWELSTGRFPIQLASTGSSPLPVFHDIVNNTDFNGTILIGVTPGLFFSTTYPEAFPWQRPQSKVDYFHNETYAQKLNYRLSIPLQKNLVLMSGDEEEWEDDIDLKSILRTTRIGNRTGKPIAPPFYSFGDVSISRNMNMMPKTANDTAFANSIIKVWHYFGAGAPPPDKESTMAFFMKDLKKFKERNGSVILVRCPSSGGVRMGESKGLPKEDFWDILVQEAKVPSYHYEDYAQLKNLKCPEESHLTLDDAKYFTNELVNLLKKDNVITHAKTN